MKKVLVLTSLFFLTSFRPAEEGVYRWDYKILIDTVGQPLFTTSAHTSTIKSLVAIPRPEKEEMHNKRAAAEQQKVTITGYITNDGQEDDGDYHLVVEGSDGSTLIAEVPDPSMPKLQGFPGLKTSYATARHFVEQNVDSNPGPIKPCPNGRVKVKITGIVFFDKIAHGTGHAANGVEIHPVLKITAAN